MRRWAQIILAMWFTFSMTMAQSCLVPSTTNPSSSHNAAALDPDPPTTSGSSADPAATTADPPTASHVDLTGYTPDQSESVALTDYLTQHKLPLVGAQVLNGSGGRHAVVLYGFVGSEFGRSDAAAKARRFTADPAVVVDNRIKVRPELLASHSGSAAAPPAAGDSTPDSSPEKSYPGVDSYVDQQNNAPGQFASQFPGQAPGGSMSTMLPLIMMLGLLSMGMASGGSGFSMGSPMGGSPHGPSPYNPYPGYPSGAPYGGGSPYGSSPYGSSPFGTSPYGGPPSSPYYP
jgi:hypothetical protein